MSSRLGELFNLRLLLKTSDFISTDHKLNSKGGGGIDFNALKQPERGCRVRVAGGATH